MRTGTTAIECYRIGPRWYRPVDSASGQSRLAARCPCAPWIFRGLGDEYGGAAGEIFFGCRVQLNIAHSRLTSGSDVAKSMPGPAHAADPPFVITQRLHIHTGSISYLAATERALAHGASRWARIVNAFAFDLTTRLRYEFSCRAGPSIGDGPGGLSTGRCDLRPSQPKFGGRCSPSHSAF
jgi:hypothetical protein